MISCPTCKHEATKVIDSRAGISSDEIRRRRECLKCSYRFTTYERIRLHVLRGPLKPWRERLSEQKAAIDKVLDALIEEAPRLI